MNFYQKFVHPLLVYRDGYPFTGRNVSLSFLSNVPSASFFQPRTEGYLAETVAIFHPFTSNKNYGRISRHWQVDKGSFCGRAEAAALLTLVVVGWRTHRVIGDPMITD